MDDHEAFLRAIAADLDDDALRLVYADWLEEHGEAARAEFLRLQSRRLTAPDQFQAVQARASRLMAAHRAEWLAPFFALGLRERLDPSAIAPGIGRAARGRAAFQAGQFLGCEFTFFRGFVTHIRLHGGEAARALVENVAAVFALGTIQRLEFVPAKDHKGRIVYPLDILEPAGFGKLLHTPEAPRLRSLGLAGPGPGARLAECLLTAANRVPQLRIRMTDFEDLDAKVQERLRSGFGERVVFTLWEEHRRDRV